MFEEVHGSPPHRPWDDRQLDRVLGDLGSTTPSPPARSPGWSRLRCAIRTSCAAGAPWPSRQSRPSRPSPSTSRDGYGAISTGWSRSRPGAPTPWAPGTHSCTATSARTTCSSAQPRRSSWTGRTPPEDPSSSTWPAGHRASSWRAVRTPRPCSPGGPRRGGRPRHPRRRRGRSGRLLHRPLDAPRAPRPADGATFPGGPGCRGPGLAPPDHPVAVRGPAHRRRALGARFQQRL